MRLRRVLVGLCATFVVVVPSSALAKPPFTVELSPPSPSEGESVEITIRFWDDAEHSDLAGWPSRAWFEAFLWAFPRRSSSAGPQDAIPIDVTSVRRGVMRGELVFPSAGAWTVCSSFVSCVDEPEVRGSSRRTDLLVSARPSPERATLAREAGPSPPSGRFGAPVAMAVAVAAVLTGTILVRRLRRPSSDPTG